MGGEAVSWKPPPPGFSKFNFDGSAKGLSAAAGIIIRDSKGDVIKAISYNLGIAQSFITEATTLHMGILSAISLGIQNLIIEGDNLLVINVVQNIWRTPL